MLFVDIASPGFFLFDSKRVFLEIDSILARTQYVHLSILISFIFTPSSV